MNIETRRSMMSEADSHLEGNRIVDAWSHALAAIVGVVDALRRSGVGVRGALGEHGVPFTDYSVRCDGDSSTNRNLLQCASVAIPVTFNDGQLIPHSELTSLMLELVCNFGGATFMPALGICNGHPAEFDVHLRCEVWDSDPKALEALLAKWLPQLGQRQLDILRTSGIRTVITALSLAKRGPLEVEVAQ